MTKLQNPFVTGGYVDPEYFCDREKETEQLLKSIQNGNNVTLDRKSTRLNSSH